MVPVKYIVLLLIASLVTVNSAQALTGNVKIVFPNVNGTFMNLTGNEIFPFTFNFAGDKKSAECSLVLNGTVSNTITAQNNTNTDIYASSNYDEGEYTWYISCLNGTAINSSIMTMYTDGTAPQFANISPSNGYIVGEGITFNVTYTYYERAPLPASCISSFNSTTAFYFIFALFFLDQSDNIVSQSYWIPSNTSFIETTTFNLSLSSGSYEWNVTCVDFFGHVNTSQTRTLIVVPGGFSIDITSPQDGTYDSLELELEFSVSGDANWTGYSLDGMDNVTVTGNTTFNVGEEGQHTIELYANGSSGYMAYDSVHFTVLLPVTPPPGGVDFVSPSDAVINRNFLTVNVSTDDPVESCLLSVDGDDNVSMTEVSDTSWYYSLTSLSEGVHDLKVWCNDSGTLITDDISFRVLVSGFNIEIETPVSKTYWAADSFEILVHINIDADACMFYLNSQGPAMMQKYTSRMWHYNMSDVDEGSYNLLVRCNDTSGFYNSSSVSFTLKAGGCEDNETGSCTDTQQCIDSKCVDITCGECEYAEDHTCKPHECCSDDDCLAVQECVSNKCAGVQCDCGVIKDHVCIEYGCCSNFDCEINEECDLGTHNCTKRALTILAPDSITAGQVFTISLVDDNMEPVPGAKIKIEYKSGVVESLTTDEEGSISLVAKESGPIYIIADIAGYDREIITAEVIPGIDLTAMFLLVLILAGGGTGFFYWRQMPPLTLKKDVNGQNVLLKIKNRSGEYMDGVLISDSVPKGAFISCGLMPRVEDFGNETNLTWFASLNEGEEIVINYQAVQTSDKFLARVGDDEYQSGFGFMTIVQDLIGKIHPGKSDSTPA